MKEEFNPEVENTTSPEINTQPVVPIAPVEPVQPVVPTDTVAPSVPETPVAPVQEPVQVSTPIQEQPIQPTPLQPVEEEKPKKKSIIPSLLIIFFILVIAGCLVYYFFLKDKIGGTTSTTTTTSAETTTTETTVKTLTEEDAKKISLDLLTQYYSNGLLTAGNNCSQEISTEGYYDENFVGRGDNYYAPTEVGKTENDGCNGGFKEVVKYKTIDDLKKYINSKLTKEFTDTVIKKYGTANDRVYCCLVVASPIILIEKDSIEISDISIETESLTLDYKYVSYSEDGGDDNGTPVTIKTSKDVFNKAVIKAEDGTWKIDSVTFVKNGESKEEKVYE